MRTLVPCCTFVALLTGCFLNFRGESYAGRDVSVQLAAQAGEDGIALPVNGAEVQDALALVDQVLLSHGFKKFQPSPPPERQHSFFAQERARGVVAYYCDGRCTVSFKDNTLRIGFTERGRTHSSATVKAVCDALRSELTKRYGAVHVKGP